MERRNSTILGIDLGGTKILSAVIDQEGRIIARDHSVTPAQLGPEAVIGAVIESVHSCLDQISLPVESLEAIGVGAPGPSNPETGILFTSPNLPGWLNVPIRDIIRDAFKIDTFLINDANAAAVGEHMYGAGKGTNHFIYVTVSTGIGGGVIIDGRLLTGAIGTAGELGHMVIDHNGPPCHCGNRGCWETLASGTALARFARERIRDGSRTSLLDHAAGNIQEITAKTVQEAAAAGDNLAKELIEQTGYFLGVGLTNLVNIFNPEVIAIGGGVALIGDMLFAPAFDVVKTRAFRSSCEAVRFVPAALGRNSGVIGSAAHALRRIRDTSSFSCK
ncbi:MAG: ROK family protein [Syntrophales bacterium]|jgi:glucokinase|nr:ROK family protein [Syntrophales bacterium]